MGREHLSPRDPGDQLMGLVSGLVKANLLKRLFNRFSRRR
jgi:hypothetical protein